MIEAVSLFLSLFAVGVSIFTFWYTALRRGSVKMTQPTQVGIGFGEAGTKNQVFVRCLLFATSKRGAVLENMYARVRCGERSQNFSIWVHGQPHSMSRGAGLLVSESGLAANFHFLLRPDEPDFPLTTGIYKVEIIGRLLRSTSEVVLTVAHVEVTPAMTGAESAGVGLQFDWAPDSNVYVGHVAKQPSNVISPSEFASLLDGMEP
jgi:hypothetical protein